MARAKRNLFAMLGWVVWKLLALVGVKYAKDKISNDARSGRRSR